MRGDNLCAWESGLRRPLRDREIVIDPVIGRVLFGVANAPQRDALLEGLWIGYTYAAVGPVGAHPVSRPLRPTVWDGAPRRLPFGHRFSKQPGCDRHGAR